MDQCLPDSAGVVSRCLSEVVVARVEDAVAGAEDHVDRLGRRRRLELTADRLQAVCPQPGML